VSLHSYDVIGGAADGSTFRCDRALPATVRLGDETYIAIEFETGAHKQRRTIFMLANTVPAAAVAIWTGRQSV
jgi:hypothetical protein